MINQKRPRRPRGVLGPLQAAALWLFVAGTLTGCWYRAPEPSIPEGAGAVTVTVQMASHEQRAERVHVVLRLRDIVLEHTVPVVDGVAETILDGVYAGHWDAVFEVWDEEGFLTHRGQSQVTVLPDESTPLHIVLDPLPGLLRVRADLRGFAEAHGADRARLLLQPQSIHYDGFREENEDAVYWEREAAPGTYDVQIALYRGSFHSYNLVYAGPWFTVDVHPGRTLDIRWHPATGRIEFSASVRALPSAPLNVTARRDGDGVVVEWVTTSRRAAESVLWWRTDPFASMTELVRLPAQPALDEEGIQERFRHEPGDEGIAPGTELVYGVTTVDGEGIHSLRTVAPPLRWP